MAEGPPEIVSPALAYLDWIEVDYQRYLKADNDQLIFYSPDTAGIYRYSVDSLVSNEVFVFNVTQFDEVKQLPFERTPEGRVEFIDSVGSGVPQKFIVFDENSLKKPLRIEQDFRSVWRSSDQGADFIIITYDDFYDAVLALKSLREDCDSLKTAVVKVSDIYDEFSCGLTDPVAIRDFIKYSYENWHPRPGYVLLFGDGDYDYQNRISPDTPNWIPPFETDELSESVSRCRDDWYVCVDGEDNLLDLAIGRIPVTNFDQALNVVKKIIDYHNAPEIGEWCNRITMVADDEFGQGGSYDQIDHVPDTEFIAEHLIPNYFRVNKIYLTEYPIVRGTALAGIRKPAATEAILKAINQGSLIINFIGHANDKLWTHEHVLTLSEHFDLINNGSRQAFWIAATCNFGRYDNPESQSFAERLVNAFNGGAIAVFASCRAAVSVDNVSLNQALFQQLLSSNRKRIRIGDAVMAAKNSQGNRINDQFYHLLGDPTLLLPIPNFEAKIADFQPDSIRALTLMHINGIIFNPEDSLAQVNGHVVFTAMDSRKFRIHRVNEYREYRYYLPGNTIFRGTISVQDNHFLSRFIVPKDITYGGNDGRFQIFYQDGTNMGSGYLNNIPVGGTRSDFYDSEGPEIKVEIQGMSFQPGGFIPPNATMKVTITDSVSGINIAGDIGHNIAMLVDETEKVDLTDYFQYFQDSYISGVAVYSLQGLSEGEHRIQIKAWDNSNNSSEVEFECTVSDLSTLVIQDLLNYPNPFSETTEITFWVNQDCDIEIKVYTVNGRLIRKMDHLTAYMGFNHFFWDGTDQDNEPLANGIYLYKVSAHCSNGTKLLSTHEIQKCVIVR